MNAALRKEYEQLHVDIDQAKDTFLKAMRVQSGSKRDLEKEISLAFTPSDNQFYKALVRIHDEVTVQKEAPFASLKYDLVFDEKALEVLGTKDVKTALDSYIRKYNELIAASTYFKKGVFNYYNASTIAKNLADNGFFRAKHSIRLNANEVFEIGDEKQLEQLIAKEKRKHLDRCRSQKDIRANRKAAFQECQQSVAGSVPIRERRCVAVSFKHCRI